MTSYCPDGLPHYWQIAPGNGPTSPGACERCGAVKIFCNSQPENTSADWIAAQRQRSRQRWDKEQIE